MNKSKNTQYAYTNELRLYFQFLCNSKAAFPSSPVDVSLLHVENIGHRDIEAYLSWASVERNNGVRVSLANKQS
ncbi:MAG: phage integrase N-terminal SAM-like domain-containing protein [Desulfosporosinus sp.]|nr:phage integrase N-terminal SAM-like domain-containing protein [Desulfosporosinus sp.]